MDPGLYAALDDRLRALEREAAALRDDLRRAAGPTAAPVASGPGASAPVPAAPGAPAPGAAPAYPFWLPPAGRPQAHGAAPGAPAFSLERLVAGRGLQLAGLLMVLLGAAFFLNLAFSHGWVGPAERIVLGLVSGVALIGIGARRRNAADVPVSESLIALGSGLLYLSLWAAVALFPQLHVSRGAAFAAMIAVTAVLGALAVTRRSERIALLGLAGGFVTPMLLGTDKVDLALLAGYILTLAALFTALGIRVGFRGVTVVTFVVTLIYGLAFVPNPGAPHWTVTNAYTVLALQFALFAVAFTLGYRRDRRLALGELVLFGVNAGWYALLLEVVLTAHQTALGATLLGLAAVLLGIAVAALRRGGGLVPAAVGTTYAYLGLGAVTLALPALVHRATLFDTFAVEAALMVALGARRADRVIATAGIVLLLFTAVAMLAALAGDWQSWTSFGELMVAAALTVAGLELARRAFTISALRTEAAAPLTVAWSALTHVVAVCAITRLVNETLGGSHWVNGVPGHVQFAISFVWTAYATALFVLGMRRADAVLRWEGLALFALTIGKVFTVDLSSVDITWRIASFVVLGLVCVALSAWYMRAQAAGAAPADGGATDASGVAGTAGA